MAATNFVILPEDLAATLSQHEDTNTTASTSSAPTLPFIRLPHPRTGLPCLYLPKPSVGDAPAQILEVQSVAPDAERSWFHGQEVVSDGRLLMFTPIDPLFLLIPLLRVVFVADAADSTSSRFRAVDDIFEEASIRLTQNSDLPSSQDRITHYESPVRKSRSAAKGKGKEDRPILAADVRAFGDLECVKKALVRCCETKDVAEDFQVYRYSPSKLLDTVREKVSRLSASGVFSTFRTLQRGLGRSGLVDNGSGLETDTMAAEGKGELAALARTKAACDVLGQYLPPDLHALLIKYYDFTPLATYFAAQEPVHVKPPEGFTTVSKKTSKAAAAGKGGKDAEAKKKANGPSRAAEQLKKADTKGMSKLSNFFKKK